MEYILKRPFYTKYAWAYDRIIERPIKSDCDFVEKILLQEYSKKQLSILDAGCGTGGYSVELAKRGYKVTGVDISQEQIAIAQSKAKMTKTDVCFSQADLFDFKLNQTFDLILCRGVLNDIIENELRLNIFKIFKSLLKNGGVLVFDVRDWKNSYIAKSNISITEKNITMNDGQLYFKSETSFNIKLQQLLIKETHILKTYKVNDIDEYNFIMQCWGIDELNYNLDNAQFTKIDYYGDYNFGVDYGESEKIIVVAK